jgi:uncharacterized protein YigA (DUF484 family)
MLQDDEHMATLFQWERAFEKAIRALTLFGDHWETCGLRSKPVKTCSCGFLEAKRELAKMVPS